MSDATPYRLEATVHGRVQGVGFRHFTRQTAQRLSLTGWVANAPDGTVRIVAEGAPDHLADFVTALHSGPPASRVDEVIFDQEASTQAHTNFTVRRF